MNMLTNEDIVKLSKVLATKEDLQDFYKKDEIDGKFNALSTSVDGIAKNMKDYQLELATNKYSTKRLEDWAKNTGKVIGLEYTR